MNSTRPRPSSRRAPSVELAELRARLADAEGTLRAIRSGEVDAVVVAGIGGPQVFTLQGADRAYRALIESMNEGALTLADDKTILYANRCFAQMVKCPLEQLLGTSFRRFLSPEDRVTLRRHMRRADKGGSKVQVLLKAGDSSQLSAQISIRPLGKSGFNRATIGMVVTDMTEARRTEELLRALTQRVVQVQEAERESLALELHDKVTQALCGILVRSQTLADGLSAGEGPSKREAIRLREMLGQTADTVERISRNLRPSVLEHLGLVAVLRATGTEFAERTGVDVKLSCAELTARLPADTERALFRVLQEALKNVEMHSHARHVTVRLREQRGIVRLTIKDDGIGFDPDHHSDVGTAAADLGLLSMRERATYVGGSFQLRSARRAGTEVEVRIPVPPSGPVTN